MTTIAISTDNLMPTVTGAANVPNPILRKASHLYALNAPPSEHGTIQIDPRTVGHSTINDYSPQYWFVWGNHLVIEPTPDVAYNLKLFYHRIPEAELTSTSDYPDNFPVEFRECLLDFSLYTLSIKLKKWKQASRYYNIYLRNLKKRKQEYVMRKAERRAIHYTGGM